MSRLSISAGDSAFTFLHVLFGEYRDRQLLAEVRCLAPDGARGPREWYTTDHENLSEAAKRCGRWARHWNVYVGVLPRRGRLGSKSAVSLARYLWADLDGGVEGQNGAIRHLDATDLPTPALVVGSGNGVHAYWSLAEPIDLPDGAALRRFEAVLKRLVLQIGGRSPLAHADDSAAEAARILRVPSTLNHKSDPPKPVRLLRHVPQADAWPLVRWEARLPALPAPICSHALRRTATPASELRRFEGLVRWARTPYPEGKRHKDLVSAAAWLVRDLGLPVDVAGELLRVKASVSSGARNITVREVEEMLRWA